ncbi:hypothetical protein N665_0003s0023 [Sinapis alba]|nr:hypothetical protein N665_0003s0023 [Sinapis alba]
MKLSLSLAVNALILLEVFTVVFAQAKFSNETDMKALLEFKSQAAENRSEVLASWNNSSPLCTWVGVKCGRKRERVTSVDLGGLKLAGVISPSIEVGMLYRLQYLNMSFNLLEGKIPHSLSNCYSLSTLDLSLNHLEHTVPTEIGSLSKLVTMYLNDNNLTGEFPPSLGNLTSIQELDFAYNNIEGKSPFDVARLTQMVFFQVSQNIFSGVFPPALYNMSLLESLSLAGNSFSALEKFDISTNYLTGSIPLSFGKLFNLWWLGSIVTLGNNFSSHLEFIGALANCTQLEYLDVGYNRLGGELPASIANLSTKLTILSLGENLISGTLPHDIGNLINLEKLSLETNRLTGELPISFGKLLKLQVLDLYSNAISSVIPSYLGNMTQLQKLHLSNNSFQGNLSDNFLTGSLPKEAGKLQLLVGVAASNNKLSGHLPQTLGGCLSIKGQPRYMKKKDRKTARLRFENFKILL